MVEKLLMENCLWVPGANTHSHVCMSVSDAEVGFAGSRIVCLCVWSERFVFDRDEC